MLSKEALSDIAKAVDVVRRGGIILYPTDTIWGIGCDASNPAAVERVFHIKQRADSKALICLVGGEGMIPFYSDAVPDVAYDLIEFAERPLTLILDGARNLASALIAEDGSVGLRVTKEEFSRTLCQRCKRAIVSTSANISGQPAPAAFGDIAPEIIDAVDYVCTSRRDEKGNGKPSTIIKITASSEIKIIRQ